MHRLENDRMRVDVLEQGAELQSVYDKATGREWLWQGDARWWGRRASNLFPFIGVAKNGCYTYQGQSYAMTKHGFARDLAFVREGSTFILRSTAETLKVYPFEFELKISYQLEDNRLTVAHDVVNLGEGDMIFSLGGHPAFNCPMDEEPWSIEFETAETLESRCIDLETGLILPHKKSLPSDGKPLVLNSQLFAEDALVFEQLASKRVTLQGTTPEETLTFDFEGFPLLAIWSPQGPFVCLEPWFGLADLSDSTGRLEEKYGAVHLASKAVFKCAYAIILGQADRPL